MHSLLEGMVSVSSLFLSRTSYGWCWMWSPKRDQRPPRFSPIRGWPRKLPRAPSWSLEQRSKTSRYVVPIMFLSAFLSFFLLFFWYTTILSWWYRSIHDMNFSFRAFKILKYVQLCILIKKLFLSYLIPKLYRVTGCHQKSAIFYLQDHFSWWKISLILPKMIFLKYVIFFAYWYL